MTKFILIFLLLNSLLLGQSYQIEIKNETLINSKIYEFEVYIKTSKNITITAYQCVFTFNENVINSGNLNFEYVSNSSQLINKPIKTEILFINNKLYFAFASDPGLEQVSGQKLIGRFRVINTKDFTKIKFNLQWHIADEIGTIFSDINYNNITKDFLFKPKPKK